MKEEILLIFNKLVNEENIFLTKPIDINAKYSDRFSFICNSCGETGESSVSNFLDKRRTSKICKRCEQERKFIKQLEKLYKKNPYEFIIPFKGYNAEIIVRCKYCGYIFSEKNAAALLSNNKLPVGIHPCSNCTRERIKSKKDINILKEELTRRFGSCNYIFPDEESFRGMHSKENMKITCKFCGHTMNTVLVNILNPKNGKHYCRVCNNKNRLLETISYEERCKNITSGTLIPLEPYIDSRTPILHRCNKCGYEWKKIPIKNTLRNAGCPSCKTKSKEEDSLLDFIKSLGFSPKKLKQKINNKLYELDIYIPELNIGFEFDGLYWHSEGINKNKLNLKAKTDAYNSIGIRVVHVFEDEWLYKQDIVKDKICAILKKSNKEKVYARKCEVADISSIEKNYFLNKYHIQGEDKCSISKCLKYNNEIVAVMTLSKPRISLGGKSSTNSKTPMKYELSRFATSKTVIGGFSKLFSAIMKEHQDIEEVFTYADLRWSDSQNNVYSKNGFVFDHASKPNYWYCKGIKRYHRFNFRKNILKEKFPEIYSEKLTEFQIMDQTMYTRLWDCGNNVYTYKRNK